MMRAMYSFGDDKGRSLYNDLLNNNAGYTIGGTDGEAETVALNGRRNIHLGATIGSSVEEQMRGAITMQHEAYRNGLDDGVDGQFVETIQAVMGHSAMAQRMIGDSGYQGTMANMLSSDSALSDQLAKYIDYQKTGDINKYAEYVGNNFDSSKDYWKLKKDGTLEYDGDGWLKGEDNKLIKDANGNPIGKKDVEDGLLTILGVKLNNKAGRDIVRKMLTDKGFAAAKNGANWTLEGAGKDSVENKTNMGLTLNMSKVMSEFGGTVVDAVFSTYYNGAEGSAKGDLLNFGRQPGWGSPASVTTRYEKLVQTKRVVIEKAKIEEQKKQEAILLEKKRTSPVNKKIKNPKYYAGSGEGQLNNPFVLTHYGALDQSQQNGTDDKGNPVYGALKFPAKDGPCYLYSLQIPFLLAGKSENDIVSAMRDNKKGNYNGTGGLIASDNLLVKEADSLGYKDKYPIIAARDISYEEFEKGKYTMGVVNLGPHFVSIFKQGNSWAVIDPYSGGTNKGGYVFKNLAAQGYTYRPIIWETKKK